MRPLRLELQAFGPFAQRQVIDFRDLGSKTFFLIHGPTGAGKTSILDGMCFALFGDSSGGERDGRQMRSHHADDATLTEVSFRFALGETQYVARRVPEQMRKARRGDGETRQAATADLLRIDIRGETEVAHPVATGASKVSDAVGRLLGFESRQFRQVIVLPQGKFFEFLKSSSQDREKILQTLFGTELYKQIELRLKDAANALAGEAAQIRTQRQALLDQGRVDDEAALADRHRAQDDALTRCAAAERAAALAAAAAEDAFAAGRQRADRFEELDAAAAALQSLGAHREPHAAERTRLDAARRAAALEAHAAALAALDQRLGALTLTGHALSGRSSEAAQAQVRADAHRAQETARTPELDQAIARIAELDALADKVTALARTQDEHAAASTAWAAADAALGRALQTRRSALEALQGHVQQLQDARVQAAGLDGARTGRAQAEARLAQATALAAHVEARTRAATHAASAQALAEAADARCHSARTERDRLRRDWVAGLATRLARELVDAVPCPVCGARDHPQPAQADGEPVQDDLVDAAEDRVVQADARHRQAVQALGDARQAVGLLDARIDQAGAALGGGPRALDDLAAQATAARAALDRALAAAQTAQRLDAGLAAVQRAAAEAETASQAADNASRQAHGRLQQLVGQRAERRAGVPEALAEPAALARARALAVRRHDDLNRARAAAVDAATQAGLAAVEARTRLEANLAERQSCAAQRDQQAADFGTRLAAAGFADADAHRAARLDPAVVEAAQQRLDRHAAALAAAVERHQRASHHTQEITRPDRAGLSTAHASAKAAHLSASNAVRDALAARDATGALADAVQRLAADYQDIDARYGASRKIADVAAGENPQRMSFQRYVLAALLEEVLAATALRLNLMSRGRYEIRRRLQAADQRSAAGLDLEVFDQYTGTLRAVATLSGGESFLASLALALGLSDVVQSHAGGIRLDAIFVDEGFGTLDAESLDVAIRALQDLQQAGRLVGIISHVAELKEWIDARLELTATARGSVAVFRS